MGCLSINNLSITIVCYVWTERQGDGSRALLQRARGARLCGGKCLQCAEGCISPSQIMGQGNSSVIIAGACYISQVASYFGKGVIK